MKKGTNRTELINAIAAGDVQKIKAMKSQLPFFNVITDETGQYSFSIPYANGEGNREKRTGIGDWKQSLTAYELEAMNNSSSGEIAGFDITIREDNEC